MSLRKHIAAALAAGVLLGGGVAAAPAAQASTASVQAYSCSYTYSGGYWYSGYYSGVTVVPSSSQITSAGIEAQCLLKGLVTPDVDTNPGTVDGYFGSNSQAAMKRFQVWVNDTYGAGIKEDGWPGPQTWPWLRSIT